MWTDIKRIDDEAENVTKFVFARNNAVAEAVLYKYPTYRERTVICISTQSGCPVGCRFCGAGDSFVRSLTDREIITQVEHCLDAVYSVEGVDPKDMGRLQIMFMSMGEPLLNLRHLETAIKALYARYPNAALLISTIGPDIGHINYLRLMDICQDVPTVGLQFSIHESTDGKRDALIPFKKKLSLENIAFYGHLFKMRTGRKAFFNYCAHDHNSTFDDAERLRRLFSPDDFCATVSVVCERNEGLPATNDHQRDLATDFAEKLVGFGYDTRVFDPAGQDTIGGGCGQLWFVQDWMNKHPELARPSVGRGLEVRHAPTVSEDIPGGIRFLDDAPETPFVEGVPHINPEIGWGGLGLETSIVRVPDRTSMTDVNCGYVYSGDTTIGIDWSCGLSVDYDGLVTIYDESGFPVAQAKTDDKTIEDCRLKYPFTSRFVGEPYVGLEAAHGQSTADAMKAPKT